jgi:hypothetical protein
MKIRHRIVNKIIDIFLSRKFVALVLSFIALVVFNKITEYTFGGVVLAYMGANLLDSKIKKKNREVIDDTPNM